MIAMRGLLERTRLAFDQRLSMSNLPDRLARLYGTSTALVLRRPLMPSLSPRREISFWELRCLSDLVAEALIRALDLRKGERVLVLTPEAGESILLVTALVRAGGITVPLAELPGERELDTMLREGGIGKALVGGGFFHSPHVDRVELLRERKGFLAMPVDARDAALGETSLEESANDSSGFFIPYTIKPGSVVVLSPRRGQDGKSLLVMATSRALLHPARTLACLLPVRPGERCLFPLPLDGASRLAAAVLALGAGLCLDFTTPDEATRFREEAPGGTYGAVVTDPPLLSRLAREGSGAVRPFATRLWVSLGELEGFLPESPRAGYGPAALRESLVLFLEFLSLEETAPLSLMRVSISGGEVVLRTPFLPLPPHRVRLNHGSPPGRRSVEAIRGPAVTPGWWNDLEASLRALRKGWFHPHAAFPRVTIPARET